MLKIDTKQIEKLELELRNMHKSALPNVVRNTLNDLAFDVKKTTLKEVTNKEFTVRSKNFFKANSGVEKASGWNVMQMESTVGMIKKDTATANLEQQDEGGWINKRAFIPLKGARVSKNNKNKISSANKLSNSSIVNTARFKRGSKKRRIFKGVYAVRGTKRKILHNDVLYSAKGIRETKKGLKFKLTPIYSYKKNRSVTTKGTNFMQKSSLETIKKLDLLYKKNFDKQVAKLKKSGKI